MIPYTSSRVHRTACRRCFSVLRAAECGQQHHDEVAPSLGPLDTTSRIDVDAALPLSSDTTVTPENNDLRGEPWKTLLEMPARAAWRVSDPNPPLALESAQRQVFQRTKGHYNQTLKQLKLVHESVIQTHKELALRRHRERMRTLHGKEPTKLDERRDAKNQPVMYGPEETLATLRFRLYPNFAVAKRVLSEAKSLLTNSNGEPWRPKHVLDFGIGCGSATAAALNVWDNQVEWIHGVDPSESMRTAAQAMLETYTQEQSNNKADAVMPRLTLGAHLSSEIAPPSFDLVLFTHTATELPHGSAILTAAAVLWDKLLPQGLFVMIEPGTPDGFSSVRTVRNMLLDCANTNEDDDLPQNAAESCHVIAPCTHNGQCPMEQYTSTTKRFTQIDVTDSDGTHATDDGDDDQLATSSEDGSRKGFCSFVQTIPGHGSTKGEKFSYLVVQKRDRSTENLSDQGTTFDGMVKALHQALNGSADDSTNAHQHAVELEDLYVSSEEDDLGLEFLRGDENRSNFGRIIRSPLKKKGHIHVDYCRGPGRMERQIVSKSMSRRAPGIYAAARKARWGGFWPVASAKKS